MLVGELSRRTGVSERSLRYYEEQGLLRPARRPSGYREYGESDVDTVRRIRTLLAAGVGTTVAAEVLDRLRDGAPAAGNAAGGPAVDLAAERDRISAAIDDLVAASTLLAAAQEPAPSADGADPPPDRVPDRGLGPRIRDLRTGCGLTQRELAGQRYSRALVAAVEAGRRTPTGEFLAYLAGRLGVAGDDLWHGRPAGAAGAMRAELESARRMLANGDADKAAAIFADVAERADRYQLPEVLAYARFGEGEVLLHHSDPASALEVFRRAATVAPGGLVGARVTARVSNCLFFTRQIGAAVELVESALRELRTVRPVDPDVELRLSSALIHPYLEMGAVERAGRVVEDGLALAPRVTDRETVAAFYMTAGQVWDVRGQLGDVDRALTTARGIFAELGMADKVGNCHWAHGYVLARHGRLDEAGRELVRAREILDEVGVRHGYAGATVELAEVRRRQGRLDEAAALGAEATELAAGYDEGVAESDRLLGRIAAARGDTGAAAELLARAIERFAAAGLTAELARTCRELGELMIDQGRLGEAVAILRRGVTGIYEID